MSTFAFLAGVFLVLNGCHDSALLTDPGPTRVSGPPLLLTGPGGSQCLAESIVTGGDIKLTSTEMHFSAFSRNDCWQGGTVELQGDLRWGAVSNCDQDVPVMIKGRDHPSDSTQWFYSNPATDSIEVRRTYSKPEGSLIKVVMERQHRFRHYGNGPYQGAYTDYPDSTIVCGQLAVSITGPGSVSQAGTYTYSASASGGSSYSYQWYVAYGGGFNWSALGTGSSQGVSISESSGNVRVRVIVTSGNLSAEAVKFVENAITSTPPPEDPPPEECIPNPPYTECPL